MSVVASTSATPELHRVGSTPLAMVRLTPDTAWDRLVELVGGLSEDTICMGVASDPLPDDSGPALAGLDLTLAPDGPAPYVVPAHCDQDRIQEAVLHTPAAAATFARVLRLTEVMDVVPAVTMESYAYSMLLAGPEFQRWLAAHERREPQPGGDDAVVVGRLDDVLTITLNRPERRNSFTRVVRDQMHDALELARLDDSIDAVELHAQGPAFCSGGDLDEFGTTPDVVTAHRIRTARHVGRELHRLRASTTVRVHGACIGAGCEIPAFADRVIARSDAFFQLPELSMGLIPGAGGTVSIPRRIGRWRAAYLGLSARRLDAKTALEWGLVDVVE